MRILIVFYSRTGTTRKVAEDLKARLNADIEEIIDLKSRSGMLGYVTGGRDALKRSLTEIGEFKFDASQYDQVVVGTPVWAGLMVPAVRTWLDRNKGKIKALACFTAQGGAARQRVFDDMAAFTGLPLKAEFFLRTKEVVKGEYQAKLDEFAGSLG